MLNVQAQVTACQCACEHCAVYGNHNGRDMGIDEVAMILRNMQEYRSECFFFPLFDVTNHPDFIEIMRLSRKFGYSSGTMSINGVRGLTDAELESLQGIGITDFQLAFHGIGQTHDRFVHYPGAYEQLISLIDRAGRLGFKFWICLFANKENTVEIPMLAKLLRSMPTVAGDDVGIVLTQYFGRAIRRESLWFTRNELDALPFSDELKIPVHTETEWLGIAGDGDWNNPVFVYDADDLDIYIDNRLDVYFRPYNQYYFPGLPDAANGFRLGNLKQESLSSIIRRANERRPPYIKALEEVTAAQLAGLVGKEDETVYEFHDVPRYKWPYEYLKLLFS